MLHRPTRVTHDPAFVLHQLHRTKPVQTGRQFSTRRRNVGHRLWRRRHRRPTWLLPRPWLGPRFDRIVVARLLGHPSRSQTRLDGPPDPFVGGANGGSSQCPLWKSSPRGEPSTVRAVRRRRGSRFPARWRICRRKRRRRRLALLRLIARRSGCRWVSLCWCWYDGRLLNRRLRDGWTRQRSIQSMGRVGRRSLQILLGPRHRLG